ARVVNRTRIEFGALHILFNNAGITRRADVVELDEADWDRVMSVNVRSVFLMSKFAIPLIAASGGGSIINTASGWGLAGGPRAAVYCASKGAVVLLTKAMAIDHGPQNIRVNCICPGDTTRDCCGTKRNNCTKSRNRFSLMQQNVRWDASAGRRRLLRRSFISPAMRPRLSPELPWWLTAAGWQARCDVRQRAGELLLRCPQPGVAPNRGSGWNARS